MARKYVFFIMLVSSTVVHSGEAFHDYFSPKKMDVMHIHQSHKFDKKNIPLSKVPREIVDKIQYPNLKLLFSLAKIPLSNEVDIFFMNHNGCEDEDNAISLATWDKRSEKFTGVLKLSDKCSYEGSEYIAESWFIDLDDDGVFEVVSKSQSKDFDLETFEYSMSTPKISVFMFDRDRSIYVKSSLKTGKKVANLKLRFPSENNWQ